MAFVKRVSILVGLSGAGAVLDTHKWPGWRAEARGQAAVSVPSGLVIGFRRQGLGAASVGLGGAAGDT